MSKIQLAFAVLLVAIGAPSLSGQAISTASRVANLQIGVDFSVVRPDYATDVYHLAQPTTGQYSWRGYGAYVDLDLRSRFGIEANFHALSGPDPVLYERTYQIGPRFVFPVARRFAPYAKVLVGRGVFNFAALDANTGSSVQIANLAYNTQTLGGGLDWRIRPGLNIRVVDYEYQRWDNFPPNKLNPQVISFGAAYQFHGPLSKHSR